METGAMEGRPRTGSTGRLRILGWGLIGLGILLVGLLSGLKVELDKQGLVLCTAIAANPDLSMTECPAHSSTASWIIPLVMALALVVVGGGLFLIFLDRAKDTKAVKLDAEERRLYDIVRSGGGSAYQSDLIAQSGFSKVKVTRVLDRLETKRVVERRRRGMTNLVLLR